MLFSSTKPAISDYDYQSTKYLHPWKLTRNPSKKNIFFSIIFSSLQNKCDFQVRRNLSFSYLHGESISQNLLKIQGLHEEAELKRQGGWKSAAENVKSQKKEGLLVLPISKWLITMASWGYSPFKWPKWLINGGHKLLTKWDGFYSWPFQGWKRDLHFLWSVRVTCLEEAGGIFWL